MLNKCKFTKLQKYFCLYVVIKPTLLNVERPRIHVSESITTYRSSVNNKTLVCIIHLSKRADYYGDRTFQGEENSLTVL